ncbi:MAG TPA: caspase family protein [Terriglobia bacterium]|nr:caspase family protein [Terriglobia bacterium]
MARKALIIATSQYEDPDLRQLVAPAQDAESLQRVLSDPEIGGFEVSTLLNRPASEVSAAVEDFFLDRTRDDLLFLYFSGHGLRDENGHLYFATADTRLLDHTRPKKATAVSATFVKDVLQSSNSRRQVLVLDCCYSGAFASGLLARGAAEVGVRDQFEAGRGLVVLTASNAIQQSFEKADGEPSVFTRHLVRGVATGDADMDRDGRISLDELYEYVHDHVKVETPQQRPMKWAFDVEGEIVIAQVPDAILKPAELPVELQQAIVSRFTGAREDAVHDLELLLRGKHKGLARAALEALQRLRDTDDSRLVIKAACESLASYEIEQHLQDEADPLAAHKAEQERAERDKTELERKAREAEEARRRAEEERRAAERAEADRKSREKAEQERAERDKAELERKAREAEEARRRAEEERYQWLKIEAAEREKRRREQEELRALVAPSGKPAVQGEDRSPTAYDAATDLLKNHWQWLASGLLVLVIAGSLAHVLPRSSSRSTGSFKGALTTLPPNRIRMDALTAFSAQLGELMNRGDSYYESGDYQHAIEQYQSALGLDPHNLGLNRKVEGARAALQQEIESLTGRGSSAQENGDNQHALEQYQSALALDPDNPELRQKTELARTALEKQIDTLISRGDDYYASQQWVRALALYLAARDLDSNRPGLGRKVGLARVALKQQIEKTLTAGDASYGAGHYDDAIRDYQNAQTNAQALGTPQQNLNAKINMAQQAKSTELAEGTLRGSAAVDLNLQRMVRLLQGGVPDERMRVLASKNHISFERTQDVQDKLRAAGATDELLAMIPTAQVLLSGTSTSSSAREQSAGKQEGAGSATVSVHKFPVTHQHTIGSCSGLLIIGNGQVEYQTDHNVDGFKSPLSQIVYGQTKVGGFYLQTADGKRRYFFSSSLVEIIQLLQQLDSRH